MAVAVALAAALTAGRRERAANVAPTARMRFLCACYGVAMWAPFGCYVVAMSLLVRCYFVHMLLIGGCHVVAISLLVRCYFFATTFDNVVMTVLLR